jgi:hypothetical protein
MGQYLLECLLDMLPVIVPNMTVNFDLAWRLEGERVRNIGAQPVPTVTHVTGRWRRSHHLALAGR